MEASIKKNISIIPAKPAYDRSIRPQMRTLRVAAYCRVSTLMEQQESSYEAQVQYYTEKIKSNPNWKLAGIYADAAVIIGLKTIRLKKFQKHGAF